MTDLVLLSEPGRSPGGGGEGEVVYLRGGSQVDDGVQGDVGFKLVQQPGVPVLVDAPLRVQEVAALKQVGRKDVPETGGEGNGSVGFQSESRAKPEP